MPAKTTRRPATPRFREPAADAPPPPAFGAIPAPTRIEMIPIDGIERDERVNPRPVKLAWVNKKAEDFHPEVLGKPVVSRRPGGTLIVLDGQNRIALCRTVEWKGWADDGRIECEIYEGLSFVEEAGIFSLFAEHRSFTPLSRFIARQTQEDPTALAITEVVERNGYQLGSQPGGDTITAVSTLEKIWKADLKRHPGDKPAVLNAALFTIVSAWPYAEGSTDQSIIDGISLLYLSRGVDFIDQDLMISVLRAYPEGPKQLKINGGGARNTISGTVGKGVAYMAGQAYDKEQKKLSKKLNFG
jgi:hypothetical protein